LPGTAGRTGCREPHPRLPSPRAPLFRTPRPPARPRLPGRAAALPAIPPGGCTSRGCGSSRPGGSGPGADELPQRLPVLAPLLGMGVRRRPQGAPDAGDLHARVAAGDVAVVRTPQEGEVD